MSRMKAVAGGILLLSSLSGCAGWRVSRAARALEERVQSSEKVENPGWKGEDVPPITVLFVEETRVVLDASLVYRAAEMDHAPEPIELPLGPWSGAPSPEWLIPELRDALSEFRVQQARLFPDSGVEPTLLLVVSPELDWIPLVRVLYSAGMAGMGPWRFAVQSGEKVGFLDAEVPSLCGSSASLEAMIGLGAPGEPCAEPVILLRPQGAEVRIIEGRSGPAGACGAALMGSSGDDAPASWPSYLPGPDGSELTLPRAGSGLDMALLAEALRRVAEIAPGCTHGLLGAERGVSWREIAPVLGSMRRDAGMESVFFFLSRRGREGAPKMS